MGVICDILSQVDVVVDIVVQDGFVFLVGVVGDVIFVGVVFFVVFFGINVVM